MNGVITFRLLIKSRMRLWNNEKILFHKTTYSKPVFSHLFFRWDDELSEVAQVWADQCASVIYEHKSDSYPKIFHERGSERMTSMFSAPPGKFIFKHFSQLFFLKENVRPQLSTE